MVHVYAWSCQLASPGRAAGAPADGSLTPAIGVTSVGTEATTPTTATALASEEAAAAGEGIQIVQYVLEAGAMLVDTSAAHCLLL